MSTHEGFFLKYYAKELKFILIRNTFNSISAEFANLILPIKRSNSLEFWKTLISNHNFLSPLLLEPLVKLAIRRLGVPDDNAIREQLKVTFNSSKHVLSFYSDQEVSDNLPKFIEF
jgi:hypothetical protein